MFNFFKNTKSNNSPNWYILSSSWKKKSIFDIFKVNSFILFSLILLLSLNTLFYLEIQNNSRVLVYKGEKYAQDYQKLLDVNNTLWYLNWLTIQKFDWNKVVKILNYLESLDFNNYKLEFNSNKQYFYVALKNVSEDKLAEIIEKWLKSWTLNYYKTNESIKIIEEGRVSLTLIFN
jgi:hypothetical protein